MLHYSFKSVKRYTFKQKEILLIFTQETGPQKKKKLCCTKHLRLKSVNRYNLKHLSTHTMLQEQSRNNAKLIENEGIFNTLTTLIQEERNFIPFHTPYE
jgi:hypothetical protein